MAGVYDRDSTKLKGPDEVEIGNVDDSLKGILRPDLSKDVMYKITPLHNAGVKNMNVNGSVTPVNFDFSPDTGETWYLDCLKIFFADSGTTSVTNFGAIAALTNGLQLVVRSNGTEYTVIDSVKNNREITCYFGESPLITPTSGFIETADVYNGAIFFTPPITLKNSTGDYVRMRVRDNLSSIDYLESCIKLWRLL